MKRLLGLDYGSKTVGAAATDGLGLTAQPVTTITRERSTKLRKTYQEIESLIREYEARKGQQVRIAPTHLEKGVRIYKDFHLAKMRTYIPNDPVDCAAALYQRIRPRMKHMETNTPGR